MAYKGSPSLLDYSSTKGAIVTFTRSLALQVERGIRVNGVAPRPVWTPLISASFSPEKTEKFGSEVPMKREEGRAAERDRSLLQVLKLHEASVAMEIGFREASVAMEIGFREATAGIKIGLQEAPVAKQIRVQEASVHGVVLVVSLVSFFDVSSSPSIGGLDKSSSLICVGSAPSTSPYRASSIKKRSSISHSSSSSAAASKLYGNAAVDVASSVEASSQPEKTALIGVSEPSFCIACPVPSLPHRA
ncbi:hypothetical protein H6P81_003169 [Aristolochia fimbriata]|uniref:Uncharacterized protein n=1 Tax=Aristolochia fimbriata TaxID=158543 RepID=A0AAV7FCX9_ARIFI|nr:hypothetical protein H6P81_003169 [Aristolochia fimbriata]